MALIGGDKYSPGTVAPTDELRLGYHLIKLASSRNVERVASVLAFVEDVLDGPRARAVDEVLPSRPSCTPARAGYFDIVAGLCWAYPGRKSHERGDIDHADDRGVVQ